MKHMNERKNDNKRLMENFSKWAARALMREAENGLKVCHTFITYEPSYPDELIKISAHT